MAKSLDIIEVKDSLQLFNTESTTIQQPLPVEAPQNSHKPHQETNSTSNKISQHSPESKGEREVVKPSTANAVVQTPVQGGGGKGEITHTTIPYTSFPNPLFRCEEAVLKIGDRVMDVINSFKGTVVGYRDERVVFDTHELGRCSRPVDLLFKLE
jgi:hypothetical protein